MFRNTADFFLFCSHLDWIARLHCRLWPHQCCPGRVGTPRSGRATLAGRKVGGSGCPLLIFLLFLLLLEELPVSTSTLDGSLGPRWPQGLSIPKSIDGMERQQVGRGGLWWVVVLLVVMVGLPASANRWVGGPALACSRPRRPWRGHQQHRPCRLTDSSQSSWQVPGGRFHLFHLFPLHITIWLSCQELSKVVKLKLNWMVFWSFWSRKGVVWRLDCWSSC